MTSSLRAVLRLGLVSVLIMLASARCRPDAQGPDIGRLPVLTSDDPEAEAEVRRADELLKAGKLSEAIEAYREFLHQRPDDGLVPRVQLSLGRILLQQKQNGEALALFSSVAAHPQPAVAEQGRFYAAITQHRLGRHDEAIEALAPMVGRTIQAADTLLLLDTLAQAYESEGRFYDAIAVLERKQSDASLGQAAQADARNEILALVGKASAADVRRLLDDLDPTGFAFRHVLTRAVKDADAARDPERTRELLEQMQEHSLPFDEEISAIALRAAAPSDANPAAVGALLSLSGRARRVGEQALRGLMLAANLPATGPRPASAPNIVFRDDGGDPARAVQAVNELVTVHRVIAIIGPLDAQVANAAGSRAQELGVPLIALTPAGAPPAIGSMVFRYFPTPLEEARALAAAAKRRGAKSFAVLYPQTAYGETMLAAFRDEAVALGLSQGPLLSYAPGATAFGSEVAALAKDRFDALFIPDASQPIALIAPALAAAGLWSTPADEKPPASGKGPNRNRAIALLAPSVGFDPSLPKLAGRYLQGAMFSVPFNLQASSPEVVSFVQRFQESFGSNPDVFAAFAHDAYKLLRATIDAGATTRAQLASRLIGAREPGAVTPARGFSQSREAATATRILELEGETFVEP